ncbi:MAG: hypothetical protein GYA55_09960 [SAR324 cluster bacterium]|uniref:Uncharacterized protein n=1 Tax=SAR324 cluster bacterium TaxID=2024889 RepID=A0A7X9FT81_9DELT|nr:hypothetical protein [SAR324 cluster bacterium]
MPHKGSEIKELSSLFRKLALLFICTILLLFYWWYKKTAYEIDTKRKLFSNSEETVLSGREVAKEAFKFLASLHAAERIVEGKRCAESAPCIAVESSNPIAAIAWSMLGNAKLYSAEKNQKYIENIRKLYSSLVLGPSALYLYQINLTQLMEGFKASRDLVLLQVIMDKIQTLRMQIDGDNGVNILSQGEMVASLVAGEFADFYEFSGDPLVIDFLKSSWLPQEYSEENFEKYRASFLIAAKKILGQLERLQTLKEAEAKPRSATSQDFSCFIQLAKSKYFLVTQDPAYLEQLSSYFDNADFKSKASEDLPFNVLQPALACAETLKNILGKKPEHMENFRSIIENYVLPRFDYSGRPLCNGDNGFLGSMSAGLSCNGATKFVSDTAWVISILADTDIQFKISKKRITRRLEKTKI